MNALVYVNIDQGVHKGKIKVVRNEKRKKLHGFRVFSYIKFSKFWSLLLEHFVERKPLISEECNFMKKCFLIFFKKKKLKKFTLVLTVGDGWLNSLTSILVGVFWFEFELLFEDELPPDGFFWSKAWVSSNNEDEVGSLKK